MNDAVMNLDGILSDFPPVLKLFGKFLRDVVASKVVTADWLQENLNSNVEAVGPVASDLADAVFK